MKIILLSLLLISNIFASGFESKAQDLVQAKTKAKGKIIIHLGETYAAEKRLLPLLKAMLQSKLYYVKSDESLVYLLSKEDGKYHTKTVFDDKVLPVMEKSKFKKVKTTNKLRSVIRNELSQLNLLQGDVAARLAAAKNIHTNLKEDSLKIVNKALQTEKESKIIDLLNESKLILTAKFSSGDEQKNAINTLGDSLSQESIQALEEIDTTNNTTLNTLIGKSISNIRDSRNLYAYVERAFFGLSMASILLLAALGLSITFGLMKVINMAHGELIMIGAYTTFTLQTLFPNLIEYSLLMAIPVAFIVSAIVGILIERFVIRHLYSRPLETLLATFGISLILQQLVRSIYSPLNQVVKSPEWMSGTWEINGALSLTYGRVYIIIFSVLVFLSVLYILKKTSLGLKVRAVTQNRPMAQAMGINTRLIDSITFGLGSGLAGIAGVALSQLTNVGPNLGQAYIVDSFMVVVFGGVGNLWGTVVGALTIGELNKFLEPSVGAILTKVLVLVMIILFIQKKPRGLFPQKGRDAED